MATEIVFDVGKVADVARRIGEQRVEVERLRREREEASRRLNSAETVLSNLQIELTRAVAGQLDYNSRELRAEFQRRQPKPATA
jgi:hypothetical protein